MTLRPDSNSDELRLTVTIARGSIVGCTYYANFMHNGQEDNLPKETLDKYKEGIKAVIHERHLNPASYV